MLCALLLAAGCGQKGPLYLPGDPNEGRILVPSAEDLPGADEDEDDGSPENAPPENDDQ